MRLKLCLVALAATTAFASPAYAQVATDTETAEARGLVLLPLTLTLVQDLDFGTVVASPVAGNVVIDPDTGGRTTSPGVTHRPPNRSVSTASWAGRSARAPTQAIRPSRIRIAPSSIAP